MSSKEEKEIWENRIERLLIAMRGDLCKKVYFLLTANLACLGYSVDKTMNLNLTWDIALLSCSLCCFILSTHKGVKFLQHLNKHQYDEVVNIKAFISDDPDNKDLETALINSDSESTENLDGITKWLYIGVGFFIIWRFAAMSGVSSCDIINLFKSR